MATNVRSLGQVSANPSVTNEALADYLRATLDVEGVAEMASLRAMAEKLVGEQTSRAVLNTSFRLSLPEWPSRGSVLFCPKVSDRQIELPRSPLVSVTSVKYYDEDGVQQTLDDDSYLVITSFEPGLVFLKDGYEWPETYERPDAIQIEFVAGYGEDTADADPVLRHAILLLARHFYSGGTPNIADTADGLAAERLLLGQRVSGFVR